MRWINDYRWGSPSLHQGGACQIASSSWTSQLISSRARGGIWEAYMTRSILAGVLSAAVGIPALAQGHEEFSKRCFENSSPDGTIEACSAVIAGGQVDRKDLATAFKNRGNALDDKGQYDRAIQDYDHAIAINPKDADAFNNRGTTYRAKGQYDLAIQDYDQALRLTPNSAMALNNRCFAKALMGQLEEALADCNESLRLRSGDANTLASRAFT